MPGQNGKFILITIIFCLSLVSTACGSFEASEEVPPDAKEIEIQSVPTVTPTNASESELRTEIIEPISPIASVIPTGQSTVSSTTNTIQPIPGSQDALDAAIKDLSEQTGSPPNEIVLVSIEAAEWSDTSLGCPQEGFMYAQVITPGYKMVLEAQGHQYEYHTNQTTNVVLCQE